MPIYLATLNEKSGVQTPDDLVCTLVVDSLAVRTGPQFHHTMCNRHDYFEHRLIVEVKIIILYS